MDKDVESAKDPSEGEALLVKGKRHQNTFHVNGRTYF